MDNNQELQQLKDEYNKLKNELKDLSEDELEYITGGLLTYDLGGGTFDVSLDTLEDGLDIGFKPEEENTIPQK